MQVGRRLLTYLQMLTVQVYSAVGSLEMLCPVNYRLACWKTWTLDRLSLCLHCLMYD